MLQGIEVLASITGIPFIAMVSEEEEEAPLTLARISCSPTLVVLLVFQRSEYPQYENSGEFL